MTQACDLANQRSSHLQSCFECTLKSRSMQHSIPLFAMLIHVVRFSVQKWSLFGAHFTQLWRICACYAMHALLIHSQLHALGLAPHVCMLNVAGLMPNHQLAVRVSLRNASQTRICVRRALQRALESTPWCLVLHSGSDRPMTVIHLNHQCIACAVGCKEAVQRQQNNLLKFAVSVDTEVIYALTNPTSNSKGGTSAYCTAL